MPAQAICSIPRNLRYRTSSSVSRTEEVEFELPDHLRDVRALAAFPEELHPVAIHVAGGGEYVRQYM